MDLVYHSHLHRINPADLELERRFIQRLTPHTKRLRFLAAFGEPSDAQLIRLVSPDPDTELALAWVQKPAHRAPHPLLIKQSRPRLRCQATRDGE